MPLDGLRAWIGEVERKLSMRTRVFLVLATIAIGVGGAAIYLAIDTRDNAISESDVQQLQEDLEGRIGTGSVTGGAEPTQVEAELKALQAEVQRLRGEDGASANQDNDGGGGATGASGTTEGDGPAPATNDAADAATGGASPLPSVLPDAKDNSE